jgi:RNA polymerase sigma factor (TIGR02999 family)
LTIAAKQVQPCAGFGGIRDRAVGKDDIGAIWEGFSRGDRAAREALLALHYQEFRVVARRVLRDDGNRLAMQPTDLAHEAALRILKLTQIDWRDRGHFLALSARVMRQTLIDEVRRFKAAKRQSPEVTASLDGPDAQRLLPIERLDDALSALFAIDADRARVVELRFYGGLTLPEIARETSLSESTVERRWRSARAWLLLELAVDP